MWAELVPGTGHTAKLCSPQQPSDTAAHPAQTWGCCVPSAAPWGLPRGSQPELCGGHQAEAEQQVLGVRRPRSFGCSCVYFSPQAAGRQRHRSVCLQHRPGTLLTSAPSRHSSSCWRSSHRPGARHYPWPFAPPPAPIPRDALPAPESPWAPPSASPRGWDPASHGRAWSHARCCCSLPRAGPSRARHQHRFGLGSSCPWG